MQSAPRKKRWGMGCTRRAIRPAIWPMDWKRAGSDALGTARQSAADLGQHTRRGFLDVLEREPLVIGAIGVAVGAAIGALLPATAAERQHLGAAGEAMKDQAAALVDRGVTMAKETAGEVCTSARY